MLKLDYSALCSAEDIISVIIKICSQYNFIRNTHTDSEIVKMVQIYKEDLIIALDCSGIFSEHNEKVVCCCGRICRKEWKFCPHCGAELRFER